MDNLQQQNPGFYVDDTMPMVCPAFVKKKRETRFQQILAALPSWHSYMVFGERGRSASDFSFWVFLYSSYVMQGNNAKNDRGTPSQAATHDLFPLASSPRRAQWVDIISSLKMTSCATLNTNASVTLINQGPASSRCACL